jgi:hypothetical protein
VRYLILLSVVVAAAACGQPKVDRDLVGTWDLNVPNADGVARWVWAIHANGTYDFHAEGPGNVPAHNGTFEARAGKYSLHATTMAWDDDGTYVVKGDSLSAAGKLGSAVWTRVRPGPPGPPGDAATPPPSDPAPKTGGGPAVYTGAQIYDLLSHDRFDPNMLDAPLALAHDLTVDLDARQKSDGAIGVVEADVTGSSSDATITFVVYRDRAAAEAAYEAEGVVGSQTFRSQPGEFVSSHMVEYHEQGQAECLTRHVLDTPRATITCYMLPQLPTREPLIIEGRTSLTVEPRAEDAPIDAINRTNDLLFAGMKQWAAEYRKVGSATTRP